MASIQLMKSMGVVAMDSQEGQVSPCSYKSEGNKSDKPSVIKERNHGDVVHSAGHTVHNIRITLQGDGWVSDLPLLPHLKVQGM